MAEAHKGDENFNQDSLDRRLNSLLSEVGTHNKGDDLTEEQAKEGEILRAIDTRTNEKRTELKRELELFFDRTGKAPNEEQLRLAAEQIFKAAQADIVASRAANKLLTPNLKKLRFILRPRKNLAPASSTPPTDDGPRAPTNEATRADEEAMAPGHVRLGAETRGAPEKLAATPRAPGLSQHRNGIRLAAALLLTTLGIGVNSAYNNSKNTEPSVDASAQDVDPARNIEKSEAAGATNGGANAKVEQSKTAQGQVASSSAEQTAESSEYPQVLASPLTINSAVLNVDPDGVAEDLPEDAIGFGLELRNRSSAWTNVPYAEVLKLKVDHTDPRMENRALFVASVNQAVVASSFPGVHSWQDVMAGLKDDDAAFKLAYQHITLVLRRLRTLWLLKMLSVMLEVKCVFQGSVRCSKLLMEILVWRMDRP